MKQQKNAAENIRCANILYFSLLKSLFTDSLSDGIIEDAVAFYHDATVLQTLHRLLTAVSLVSSDIILVDPVRTQRVSVACLVKSFYVSQNYKKICIIVLLSCRSEY